MSPVYTNHVCTLVNKVNNHKCEALAKQMVDSKGGSLQLRVLLQLGKQVGLFHVNARTPDAVPLRCRIGVQAGTCFSSKTVSG